MKKALYILLLAAEGILGLLMMGLVYSNLGWVASVVPVVIMAALLIPLIRQLKTAPDAAAHKKALTRIALTVLIPAAAGVILAVYVIVSLMIYI